MLSDIKNRRYNSKFVTSEWALAELVQSVRDRAIVKNFFLDGNEIAAFNRKKGQYKVEVQDRKVIHKSITQFRKFLKKYNIEIIRMNMNVDEIHEYSLKYSLETPDATHVDTAVHNACDYLVTVDRPFIDAEIAEIHVVDPDTLFSKSELRHW